MGFMRGRVTVGGLSEGQGLGIERGVRFHIIIPDCGMPGAQVELPPEHTGRLYSHKPDESSL